MMNSSNLLIKIFISICICFHPCLSQTSIDNANLNKKVTVFINQFNMMDSLNYLSSKANIPIGFAEAIDNTPFQRKTSLKIINGSVENILNRIIEADDRYSWSLEHGVIFVYPIKPQFRLEAIQLDFLEINNIEIENVSPKIFEHPKVKAELMKHKLNESVGKKYDGPKLQNPKVKELFLNKTIKEILNRLLVEKYARFWAISNFGDNNEHIRIDLFGYSPT